ncbi:MAG: cytochrome c [Bacteroidota bacterium]|nr:cytochrome c [Bacteroidota bacterium]MDP4232451.1 cytochrome c [Bacteroidota bacterium]MDP4241587.1 cytochrome c [Bacteroidota bacterium]MDP4286331.1 cytochrome c [Bacteroidota bacterium]
MKKLALPVVLGLTTVILTSAGRLTPSASSGKAIFEQYKCSKCHTISSQGIEREGTPPAGGKLPPDLSGVGLRHDAAWMTKWLLKEEEQNGKKHMKKFTGPDDELKTLTTWLATLKKK